MESKEPIIDMHDTWLVINSIQGCTNGCKYCFLQGINNNLTYPQIIVPAEEVVERLLSYKYYDSKIPICLLPGTDAFLNANNINYMHQLLNIIDKKEISNPIVLITKCLIPENILDDLERLTKKGKEIIVFLSYSGLTSKYEPNIKKENIILNFKHLAARGVRIIHYYRPFIPENSSAKQITEMLDFVDNYTKVSQIGGLKLRSDFIDKIDIVDLKQHTKEELLNASCIWPKEAYDYFYHDYNHSHSVFQTNQCAIAETLEKACPQFYGTYECHNYNHCSKEQRIRCAQAKKVQEQDLITKLKYYLEKLNITNYEIIEEKNNIILKGEELTTSDAAYLTIVLGYKITIENNDDKHFKSSMTNSKPLIY
jgi:DNA repair photolyase